MIYSNKYNVNTTIDSTDFNSEQDKMSLHN